MTTDAPASVDDIVHQVRDAHARGAALRIVGGARWLDAGAPCAASDRLHPGALRGIVEYEPGDLTLTARAGTTLAEVAEATRAHAQWLPLDPAGAATSTLGAVVATASAGPLAAGYGTPRDQVLGCEVVTGEGAVVRAGGRVVKNVAGFDLVRLMVGAWGTLGAITEVTVRLRALPEADATVAIALGGGEAVARAWRWLRASEFTPLAAELLTPALAHALGIGAPAAPVLLLRMGGSTPLVRAALHAAQSLGDSAPCDASAWHRLASLDPAGSSTFRLSTAPSRVAALFLAVATMVEDSGGYAHANMTRGVLRCVIPHTGSDDEATSGMRELLGRLPAATRIGERLPPALWGARREDAVLAALHLGVRRAFDPAELLNPGILRSMGGPIA